jgi:hypothetical protein
MTPDSMLDLVYSLPDEKWVDLILYNPDIVQSICLGLSLELQVLENEKNNNNNWRTVH